MTSKISGTMLESGTIPFGAILAETFQEKLDWRNILGVFGHGKTYWDLAQDLVGNGVVNDTAAFNAALVSALSRGINKIISSNPSHRYKIIEAELPGSFEFILNGAGLVADYNGIYANTCATILQTSTEANAFNVTIRNALIDGQNIGGNSSGSGGHPLLNFRGGRIELDRCDIRRGANRDNTVWASYFDNMQGEVQFKNCKRVHIHDCTIQGSPGEQVQIISNSASMWGRTEVVIERTFFSKNRFDSPGNVWSSSSIVVYNCSKGSYVRDCQFDQHVKSAVNFFGPGTIEHCKFNGVSDSQAIDFDEAGSFGIDQCVVRSCWFQNVLGGYVVRASGRNIILEDLDLNRCQNGIYIETQGTRPTVFDGVGTSSPRQLYNVFLKNITGNGNEVVDGGGAAVTNSFIKIVGLSAAAPTYVYVDGIGNHTHLTGGNYPSANEEYGIDTENCFLVLKGAYSHGLASLVRMKGAAKFTAKDCLFFLQNTTNLVTFDGATVQDIVFEDCDTIQSTWTGKHVKLLNSPTISGRLYRNRSGDINAPDAGIPFTDNYTTTGTTA